MNKSILSCLVLLSMACTAQAYTPIQSPAGLHENKVMLNDKTLQETGLDVNEDDTTEEQRSENISLTQAQMHEARVWGLTQDEEKRYLMLMKNKSAFFYKGLRMTPVDILGLNARDEAERNHFAELAAEQEAQKVSKNIAWNNAFTRAYNERFKNVPVVGDFDASPYSPYAHQPVALDSGDRLYLFVKPDQAVNSILLTLTDAIEVKADTQLNIMLLECDGLAIQQWANKHQVSKLLVAQKRITLNHGDLNYKSLKLKTKTTPLLLLSRNGESRVVDMARF